MRPFLAVFIGLSIVSTSAFACPTLQGSFKCEETGDIVMISTAKINSDLAIYGITIIDGGMTDTNSLTKESKIYPLESTYLANSSGIKDRQNLTAQCDGFYLRIINPKNTAALNFIMMRDHLEYGGFHNHKRGYSFLKCSPIIKE